MPDCYVKFSWDNMNKFTLPHLFIPTRATVTYHFYQNSNPVDVQHYKSVTLLCVLTDQGMGCFSRVDDSPNTDITEKLHCNLMTTSLYLQLSLSTSRSLAPPRTTRPCEAWTELHTAGKSGWSLRWVYMSLPPPLPPWGYINRLYLEGASSHSCSDEDGKSCYK